MAAKSQPNIVKPNFKNLEPDAVLYISHLENENLKLHSEIAKFQVTDFSKSNKIKAMEKEIVKLTKHTDNVTIVLPYKIGDKLPTHVQTADDKLIEIFYKHDK